jgi:UDP-N-acetylmuramoylalanine--D-glutamate ligase
MLELLRGKKIGLLGMGVENISVAKFLLKRGFSLTLMDQRELSNLRAELSPFDEKIAWSFGEDYHRAIFDCDVLFRTPGFPRLSPILLEAEKKGIAIESQTKLFFDLCKSPIIGVTGTKGKGTTTTLIMELLNSAGKHVFIGGNIGVPPISFFDDLQEESVVVLELSSFQLQDLHRSPEVAVVLLVTSEHLDHHKSTEEYQNAKRSVVRYQAKNDVCILNADDEVSSSFAKESSGEAFFYSRRKKIDKGCDIRDEKIFFHDNGRSTLLAFVSDVKLPGKHNLENVMAAFLAARGFGIGVEEFRSVITSFCGLEHRLEYVRTVDGVDYYNDSFSTVPESAIVAIEAFPGRGKICIFGGSDKKSDYRELGEVVVREGVKGVVLIGEMAANIRQAIVSASERRGKPLLEMRDGAEKMPEILLQANSIASPSDVVIFSPACASFGLFRDYKDRGEQFKKSVSGI